MLYVGTELGILVTFGTWNEASGQKQLTALICAKEGWGDIRTVISDDGCREYRWKDQVPGSEGC